MEIIKLFFRHHCNPLRVLFILFLCLTAIFIFFLAYFFTGQALVAEKIEWGITFSQPFAEKLGINWQEAYTALLDDLKIRKLRLVAYWSEIERNRGEYNFNDLDWQVQEATERNAEVILVIGQRTPRWPECHLPDWAGKLPEKQKQKELLSFLETVVKHYQKSPAIQYWQVENEPFLYGFGECPDLDEDFLEQEITLVGKLDRRPIILTTSGELSLWSQPASRATILGTTLYRVIYNDYLGVVHYPIPPVFYYKRAQLVKKLFNLDKVFVVELQAEPWWPKQIYETPIDKQFRSMNIDEFQKTIKYAKQTGFDEVYLWGAEWWYWLKEKEHDTYFWGEARQLWQ